MFRLGVWQNRRTLIAKRLSKNRRTYFSGIGIHEWWRETAQKERLELSGRREVLGAVANLCFATRVQFRLAKWRTPTKQCMATPVYWSLIRFWKPSKSIAQYINFFFFLYFSDCSKNPKVDQKYHEVANRNRPELIELQLYSSRKWILKTLNKSIQLLFCASDNSLLGMVAPDFALLIYCTGRLETWKGAARRYTSGYS